MVDGLTVGAVGFCLPLFTALLWFWLFVVFCVCLFAACVLLLSYCCLLFVVLVCRTMFLGAYFVGLLSSFVLIVGLLVLRVCAWYFVSYFVWRLVYGVCVLICLAFVLLMMVVLLVVCCFLCLLMICLVLLLYLVCWLLLITYLLF